MYYKIRNTGLMLYLNKSFVQTVLKEQLKIRFSFKRENQTSNAYYSSNISAQYNSFKFHSNLITLNQKKLLKANLMKYKSLFNFLTYKKYI